MQFPFPLKKLTLSGEIKSKTKREQKRTLLPDTSSSPKENSQWPLALILVFPQETLQAFFNLSSKYVSWFDDEN